MKYRVSNVEAFRKWEADDEGDTDLLITDICGLGGEASQAMRAGTAFHKVLEKFAAPGDVLKEMSADGFRFTFAGDFELPVTPIRELRASKTYVVDERPITISGQVDAIEGLRIEDHKTTRRFDPDRFLQGFQWRLYLDIFGASLFRWNVFEIVEVETKQHGEGFELAVPEYEVFAQHRLEQYRYPTLEEDCQALVARFAQFVRDRIEEPVAA